MPGFGLDAARTIIREAFARGHEKGFKPLSVAVLDAGGHLVAFERQDGSSILRFQIAHGKAYGALSLGIGSRAIFQRAQQQAFFVDAVNTLAGGALVPVPGGVLVRDGEGGPVVGAVGISGDTSDNDEDCALAGIEAAGFVADAG